MNTLASSPSVGDYKILSSSVQVAYDDQAVPSSVYNSGERDDKTAIVAGCVGGGVALLLVIASIIYCCRKKPPADQYNEESIDKKEQAHAMETYNKSAPMPGTSDNFKEGYEF